MNPEELAFHASDSSPENLRRANKPSESATTVDSRTGVLIPTTFHFILELEPWHSMQRIR